MAYICIGQAVNTFGLKGELKIQSYSDFDDIRYQKGNTVYLFYENQYLPFQISSFRVHKGYSMISFCGYEDINQIEKYKNCPVFIQDTDQKDLPEGEYYVHQLIGLSVQDEQGQLIGKVTDVEETSGAQNNLRIRRDGKADCLIPNIPEFIKKVDLENQMITIHVIEGLL